MAYKDAFRGLVFTFTLLSASVLGAQTPCPGASQIGPLQIHPDNPRFFTDGTTEDGRCKAIVLTGAHTWSFFQDYDNDPAFGWELYLDGLVADGHNFTRGWVWEDDYYSPTPYKEDQTTMDGRYDLDEVNEVYLNQIARRIDGDPFIDGATQRGVYVSVMLFQGWSLRNATSNNRGDPVNPWPNFHPYYQANNTDQIIGDRLKTHELLDPQTPLSDPQFQKQLAYVFTVLDRLKNSDNVIWEITNESHIDSWDWQYELIREIKQWEEDHGNKKHLVWMSCSGGAGSNGFLTDSDNPADIVSPCKVEANNQYFTAPGADPPAIDADEKLFIADSDHLGAFDAMGNPPVFPSMPWVWRSFVRGLHPIFMDLTTGLTWWDDGDGETWNTGFGQWSDIRDALGVVQLAAGQVDLGRMAPQDPADSQPSDSKFALFSSANPLAGSPTPDGGQFLVYGVDNNTFLCDLQVGRDYLRRTYHRVNGNVTFGSFRPTSSCRNFSTSGAQKVVVVKREQKLPVASFATDPTPLGGTLLIPAGTVVDFDGTSSQDPDGGPIVTYEWDLDGDGVFGDLDGSFVSWSYTAEETLDVNLRVIDDNDDTDIADALTITVGFPPVADTLEDRFVSPGSDVTLEASVTGTGPISYQWKKDGQSLVGETADTLVLIDVESTDEGLYSYLATNNFGQDESNQAFLEMVSGAEIRDSFSGSGALDGRLTEVGEQTWVSVQTPLVIGADSRLTADGSGTGGVPFDPDDTNRVVTLEADVDEDGASWVGVGFAENPQNGLKATGQLWVELSGGSYTVWADVLEHSLASGSIPGVPGGGAPSRVSLSFDPLENLVWASLNGTEVLAPTDLTLAPYQFDPMIGGATVTFASATEDTTWVDNLQVVHPPTVYRDTFSTTSGVLNGTEVEVGGELWEANTNLVFDSGGELTVIGFGSGGLPFEPDQSMRVSTLEAEVNPKDTSSFVGVGFGAQPQNGLSVTGQLWVELTKTGGYRILKNVDEELGSGTVSGFNLGDYVSVSVSYDPVNNTAWASLDGQEVVAPTDLGTFVPDIGGATVTFGGGAVQGETRIDNLRVSQRPTIIRDVFVRDGGGQLNGYVTDVGGLTWAADTGLTLRAAGLDELTAFNVIGTTVTGSVPLDPSVSGRVVTASARMVPEGNAGNYTAVGFSDTPLEDFDDEGEIWAYILKTGVVRLRANRHACILGEYVIPGFVVGQYYRLDLKYDPLSTDASVSLDGEEVISDNSYVKCGFTPDARHVRVEIREHHIQGVTLIDDFEVTME